MNCAETGNESLAWVLREVLSRAGVERESREIAAALGLGGPWVARDGVCPRIWPKLARDVCLVECTEMYGVRLRDLHPPDAAVGLDQSAEFAAHFTDSYAPLIERALTVHQTAIVWQGWPPPGELDWGLTTESRADQLRGVTPSSGAEPIALRQPALQVYIVEDVVAKTTQSVSTADVFARAAQSWLRYHAAESGRRYDVAVGRAAMELFVAAISSPAACACGAPAGKCVVDALGRMVAARRALCAWLGPFVMESRGRDSIVAASFAGPQGEGLELLESVCDTWGRSSASPAVREYLARRIRAAYEHECKAAPAALHLSALHAILD